jgi:hypothetical protein
MPKRKTKENPLEDFKRLAREIGADTDDKVMRQLAKQKRRDTRKER